MILRAVVVATMLVLSLGAQGDPTRLREDTLKEIGGTVQGSEELARAKLRWPAQNKEIEDGIAAQDAARARGEADLQKSIEFFENRALVKESATALYLVGRVLGLAARLDEARTRFEAALKLDPYLPWSHHGLATCLATTERHEEAAIAYRRAIDLNPEFWRSYEPLAGVLMRLGRANEAEPFLRKLVTSKPDEASAWVTLGKLEAFRTRFADAIAAFDKALEIRPGHVETLRLLAFACRKGDRLDRAKETYDRLIAANPKDYTLFLALGEVLERMGENSGAATSFETAAELAPAGSESESSDILRHARDLRERPAKEKRNSKAKSPREWCDILLNSTEEERCVEAIRVLALYTRIDEDVHKALLRSLKNPSGKVRTLAIRTLVDRYGPAIGELVPLLGLFVDDKERNVRAFAVRALGESREAAAVPVLMKAINDTDTYVFREAHQALVLCTPAMVDAVVTEPLSVEVMVKTRLAWKTWYDENRDRYRKFENKEMTR